MKKGEILIILPKTISVLRDSEDTQLKKNIQEFNIYFKNIIHPYREEYDVRVYCKYGRNYGNCWRLSEFPHDVDSFELEIKIWSEYGEMLASKKTTIELYDRKATDKPYNILFFGDSMTYDQKYIERISHNLCNINFLGSRNYFGHISLEGRGGWAYTDYYEVYKERFGVSPFLFPKGVDNYIGDADFYEKVKSKHDLDYTFSGYEWHELREGGIYGKEGKLYTYKNGEFELFDDNPEWELNFGKYVKRYGLEGINAVSILMGANDISGDYDVFHESLNKYLKNTEKFIESVHNYDRNIKIIVNLPIISADQYSWGQCEACQWSRKLYDYRVKSAAEEILARWDNEGKDNVYVGPMIMCIDPENGFPKQCVKSNLHSENMEVHHSNWLHPNLAGYYQMGDAICGLIQKIRNEG